MKWKVFLPLIVFLTLAVLFLVRLADNTPRSNVPSALIGKPAPALTLTRIAGVETPLLTSETLNSDADVHVVNVWASWCTPCRYEHPQIEALAGVEGVTVHGINHKDSPADAARFLELLGNPFHALGADRDGAISLQFGVYGLPETFLIDRDGIIRAKYVGDISAERLQTEVLPMIEDIRSEG